LERDRIIKALTGTVYVLIIIIYVLYLIHALLPEWKREALMKKIRNIQRPPVNWLTETTVREFRDQISKWEHEERARTDQ